MPITTTLDKVRLEIGDIDPNAWLLTDDELNYFIDEANDNVLEAAWRACDALARRFARAYDFETDGQKFARSQMYKAYSSLANRLRERLGSGMGTVVTTRVDGYSDDVDNEEVPTNQSSETRRRYYGREDRLP